MKKSLAALPLLLLLSLLAVPPAPLAAKDADDPRVGNVYDVQGTALVSPAGRDRWTPLGPRSLLMPGDRVRTLLRGANALEIELRSGGRLVLGPGATLEIRSATDVRLLRGDLEARGKTGAAVAVAGPQGGAETAGEDPAWLRARDTEMERLDAAPRWLVGYREAATTEWMGSLVADVDGRNVPLSIGFHKVSVVIRDQVAETTIDESFVNATHSTLEGTFSFPLPADASISGFGMWIGEELVMADIVERGRAREIYEDILRRRKDPGLLEWSGGNLFKARVFPIPAYGEKRIRIRYTQVLPLEGSTIRYRYALRSEMLRAHPLRRLSIRASVASSLPIEGVRTPSHATSIRRTDHEVVVDYDAEEVTPERDFELDVDLGAVKPLTVIPHRRGGDGYFALLLSPPDPAAAGLTRELVPEGKPLDLLLLADTSGSMGPTERETQAKFLESLLGLLSPKDTFRLGAVDLGVTWFDEQARPATPQNAADALAFLESRVSLGWTDLDRALEAAGAAANPDTQVVYLGDGVGTAGAPDAAALARRISIQRELRSGTYHAVAVGSSYEKGVMEAIAAIGGGSFRDASADATAAAYGFLAEVARPAVKDLEVAFSGVRTARVYPGRLPNLPAGRQQVVLGRFDAGARVAADAAVTVTGTLDGKRIRWTAPFALDDGGESNSFLPRLWARRHVDALLAEKLTPALAEEIVAFSAEFGIMTPLTSFLVLESDEDRERYGVERRVSMSDGERFFAQAKDAVSTEILRQAMREAGTWRQQLRARVLAEIADLGRSLPVAYAPASGGASGPYAAYGVGGGAGGSFGGGDRVGWRTAAEDRPFDESLGAPPAAEEVPPGQRDPRDPQPPPEVPGTPAEPGREMGERLGKKAAREAAPDAKPSPFFFGGDGGGADFRGRTENVFDAPRGYYARPGGVRLGLRDLLSSRSEERAAVGYSPAVNAVLGLFPGLPAVPVDVNTPATDWPEEVLRIVTELDSPDAFRDFAGGLRIERTEGTLHPIRDEWLSRRRSTSFVAPGAYSVATVNRGQPPLVSWCDGETRGVYFAGPALGRKRPAAEGEARRLELVPGIFAAAYRRSYGAWRAELVARDGDRATIRFASPDGRQTLEVVVDTGRSVPLEQRYSSGGKLYQVTRWSDWKRAAGLRIAGTTETFDADGRRTWVAKTDALELVPETATRVVGVQVEATRDGIFLPAALPTVLEAKERATAGKATFADRLVLVLDHAALQRWDEAFAEWARARALVESRPGAAWIEAALLAWGRRGDEARHALLALADTLAARPADQAIGAAGILSGLANPTLGVNEKVSLSEKLLAAIPASGDDAGWWRRWERRRLAGFLRAAGRLDESLDLLRKLAKEDPEDPGVLAELANVLDAAGRPAEAIATLRAALEREHRFTDPEADLLHQGLADRLWNARRLEEFLAAVDAWLARSPARQDAWQRRHTGLLFLGRIRELDREILTILVREPGDEATSAGLAKLDAAVAHALGHTWNFYSPRLEERWWKPLGDAALRLARRDDGAGGRTTGILADWRFRQTDQYARVLGALRADLLDPALLAAMSPDRLVRTVSLFDFSPNEMPEADAATVLRALRARYETAEEPVERPAVANLVLRVLDQRGDATAAADFLRHRMEVEPPERRPWLARLQIERLLRLPPADATTDEILSLVPRTVADGARPEERASTFATVVRLVAQGLYESRVKAAIGSPTERAKLSRAELRAKEAEARQATRRALEARFATAAAAADDLLRPWYAIESLSFAAEADADPAKVEARARELLLSPPAVPVPWLAYVRTERTTLALDYVALRRDAPEELRDRRVALARARLEDADEENRDERRYRLFRILLALDRTDALVETLRSWVEPGAVASGYQLALGHLLAERGDLAAAAAALEAVAAKDELSPDDYEALATWYLCLGEDARRERALDAALAHRPEWELRSRIWTEIQRVRRRGPDGVPEDLDPEILRVERVLLGKASRPEQHASEVYQLYRATKDFRLLAALADGVVGHSPDAAYAFLTRLVGVIGGVHEEATLTEISGRVRERLDGVDDGPDRRALLYFLALVERRAAEVKNRPETHAEKALPALRAAFPDTWAPGEARHVAGFLAALGRIPVDVLAAEQLRQLAALHAAAKPGTEEGLVIDFAYARTFWAYGRHEEAIDLLLAALEAMRPHPDATLPPDAFYEIETLSSWWRQKDRFARAEDWLAAERTRQPSESHRARLTLMIFDVWIDALGDGGAVSLGSGEALWNHGFEAMQVALGDLPPGLVDDVVRRIVQLATTAQKREIDGVPASLAAFARGRLRAGLARAPNREQPLFREVAEAVHRTGDPTLALTLLVEKLETDPAWYDRVGRDGWSTFDSSLADWRHEGAAKGALRDRLAAIVLDRLERSLVTDDGNGSQFWNHHSNRFWRELADEFATVARKVVELRADSPAIVMRAAGYLWDGLGRKAEAVDVLLALDGRGGLDRDGRFRLVLWLQELNRHEEAIVHARKLLDANPDDFPARCRLVVSLGKTGRIEEGKAFIEETIARLEKQGRWNRGTFAPLADACFDGGFHGHAADAYEKALRDLEDLQVTGRRYPDALARLYGQLARCRVRLGEADAAVKAATAAVVAWGGNIAQRQHALESLRDVIAHLDDLDGWLAGYESEVAETGLDAPIIRKAVGRVLVDRRAYALAAAQLRIARELAPADREIHGLLVEALDGAGDRAGALAALVGSLRYAPTDLGLMQDLAERYAKLDRPAESERARTNYVEAEPLEAAGHSKLAEFREGRKDFDAAIAQRRIARDLRTFDPQVWFALVDALRKADRKEEAKDVLVEMTRRPWSEEAGDARRRAERMLKSFR